MQPVTSEEQLRKLLGKPHPLVENKIYTQLTEQALDFIARAPLFFVGTYGSKSGVTVSPKGDAAGLVKVLDDKTLILPDRPGNKLLHGHCNILETGQIGLTFVIPGMEETLRVNGRAALFTDEDVSAELASNGKAALLLIRVEVKQCFFHCAKAFKRSKAWQPDAWPEAMKISFGKEIAGQNKKGGKLAARAVEAAVDQAVKSDYKKNL